MMYWEGPSCTERVHHILGGSIIDWKNPFHYNMGGSILDGKEISQGFPEGSFSNKGFSEEVIFKKQL